MENIFVENSKRGIYPLVAILPLPEVSNRVLNLSGKQIESTGIDSCFVQMEVMCSITHM